MFFKLTFDFQLAADSCFSMIVLSFAGVHTTVKVTGPTDLQRADTLHADLPVLGVVSNNHLVLHPLNLGLQKKTDSDNMCDFGMFSSRSLLSVLNPPIS